MYIFILKKFFQGNNKFTPNQKKKVSYGSALEHNFDNNVIELSWNENCETITVQRCYYSSKTLDDSRNTVWPEGEVCEMFSTRIAVGSDQSAKSHYSLIKCRTKVWTMVALQSDQKETKIWTWVAQKFDHRALIDRIHLFDCRFLWLFQMNKSRRHFKATFWVYFLLINFVLALTR